MCEGFEKGLRDTVAAMQNEAMSKMIIQLRGMAGERALVGDLATTLAEDPEFAPWPGERFVTASAIRVIRSLRDRDESEVERDEASQRLFNCMAEDKMAEFVDDMYIEDDAVHYIKDLRARIEEVEKAAGYWRERTKALDDKLRKVATAYAESPSGEEKTSNEYQLCVDFGRGNFDVYRVVKAPGCEFPCSEEKRCPGEGDCPKTDNVLHAEKLSPEKWWIS